MSITQIAPPATARHAEVAEGLENLARFLRDHPGLPLNGPTVPHRVFISNGTDEQNRAEVDRIAAILGVTAADAYRNGQAYEAVRHFGGGVTYSATAMSRKFLAGNSTPGSYPGTEGMAA